MFERLKNLFKKSPREAEVNEPPPETFAPREFRRGYTPGAPIPEPPPPAAEPVQVPEEPTPPTTGDFVQIPIRSILLRLPESLKMRVRLPPSANVQISVPLPKILPQLAQGSVKISFGELRQAAPPGIFSDAGDQDQTTVDLPLPAILSQLKPEQLPRRASQKKIEVPEEVTSLFGSKGEALTAVRMSTASPPAPITPAITAPPGPVPAITPRPAPAPPPAPAIKPMTPMPGAPIKPAAPLPSPAALRPQAAPHGPAPAQTIKPTHPLPPPPAAAPRPAAVHPVVPPQPAAPIPPSAPVLQPPAPAVPLEPLSVALASVISGWPEAIRQELPTPPDAMLALPVDETEQALKRGKISFAWKRLRSWIKPPPPAAASALDETLLELPLSVIAPLFLAHKKPVAPQRKYEITEHIPDLFTGKGMAPGVSVESPAAAPATPVAMPKAPVHAAHAIAPAPAATLAPRLPRDIGEVFGQPGRKNWTPSELVQKTGALKGVAGALIAMQDGLVVASHLPPGLNGETIAAFLPQMFSRVMQYSKELKFGEASNFTIIVDDVPLKISKAGGVYFTVLGRAGEPLPEPHLSIIAAQLGPQNK